MALAHSPTIVTEGLDEVIDAGDPKCLTASDSIQGRINQLGNVRTGSGITFSDFPLYNFEFSLIFINFIFSIKKYSY